MITYVVTDLFRSPAQVLVNTVNTVGVMGKGIAKEFKQIYPEMFAQYQRRCESGQFDVGRLWLYRTPHKWVLNFPTKKHWRHPSRPEYLEAGLKTFVETYAESGIVSISFPQLGCGNGELDWDKAVRPIMEHYLKNLPIETFIHLVRVDPFAAPEHRDSVAIKAWLRSEPESLPFSEVWEDLQASVQQKPKLVSLDDDKEFDVRVVLSPDAGLEIDGAEGLIFLHKEDLLDLWQHLRGFGFAMERNMPSGLDRLVSYIVPLMAGLPYVKQVLVSRDYGKLNRRAVGLQLLPRPAGARRPLWGGVQVAERV